MCGFFGGQKEVDGFSSERLTCPSPVCLFGITERSMKGVLKWNRSSLRGAHKERAVFSDAAAEMQNCIAKDVFEQHPAHTRGQAENPPLIPKRMFFSEIEGTLSPLGVSEELGVCLLFLYPSSFVL